MRYLAASLILVTAVSSASGAARFVPLGAFPAGLEQH